MSNPEVDVYETCGDDPAPRGHEATVFDAIHARISPRSEVLRLLPHQARRMVGAWCFADVYGPRPVTDGDAMHVAPHPHTGLQTVSWLVAGQVTHRDSLGTTADVVPGRVAVMTAGSGISHAEDVVVPGGVADAAHAADWLGGGGPADGPADGLGREGPADGAMLHGAQLWVALPESERHRGRSFVLHEPAPSLEVDGLRAQVFVGSLGDVTAPAQGFTPLVGAELTPAGGGAGRLALDPAYEHILIPLAGTATVGGAVDGGAAVTAGQAMYVGINRTELELSLSGDARVLLLGGEPFEEEIVMWWNFVGRTHEDIEQARQQWNAVGDSRFGEVEHYPSPERLTAPPLPNLRLRPRGRVR